MGEADDSQLREGGFRAPVQPGSYAEQALSQPARHLWVAGIGLGRSPRASVRTGQFVAFYVREINVTTS